MSEINWYIVQTKPRKEYQAIENLQRQGFTVYCPQAVMTKRHRRKWQKVIEPLFPRYLFVQLKKGIDDFAPIRSTLGVIGLVRFSNRPAVMPESVIEAIQNQEKLMGNSDGQYPEWKKGDMLEILDGPFVGLKGIFHEKDAVDRVSLLLDILGRVTCFSVNINSLMRVG